jgi:hypothetical protein
MTRVEGVRDWQEALARLSQGHDPEQSALVVQTRIEEGLPLDGPPGWRPATIRERSPNQITVQVESAQSALLVLSEVWYPGWQVAVDGARQQVRLVNGLLRGVTLAPGTHTVVWRYRPASLLWGAALTLSALAAWLLTALLAAQPQGTREQGRESVDV